MLRRPPRSTRTDTLFPYTTLFRSIAEEQGSLPNAWPITPDQVTPAHPPVAIDRATFAGEIVAVVVARSAAAARDAAELVDVAYGELPAALDLKESAEDTVHAHSSEERRAGKEWVSTCRTRLSP